MASEYFPILLLAAIGGLIVLTQIFITPGPTGSKDLGDSSSTSRVNIHFLNLALAFLCVDVLSIFIFIWALNVKTAGWLGYGVISFVIANFSFAFFYVWKKGAFRWG